MPEQKTRIWRMTHYRNIGFILRNGLHCSNCDTHDDSYINIGYRLLSGNRGQRAVEMEPGGVLNDYIPFYFHCKMPMLYKIFNHEVPDYNGTQEDIIYIISSPEKIVELNLPFIFTDRHAYLVFKPPYNRIKDLTKLSWDVIYDETWHLNYSQLKKELKQAEFLVYKHVPVSAILGIACHNEQVFNFVSEKIREAELNIPVIARPDFYY